MKRKLQLAAGLLVSLGFVALSLRGQDVGAVWRQLASANYLYLFPYIAILLAIHLVRTVRWGMLIRPLQQVPFRRLNAVSAVGFMALVVLPFRLGELARPYLIREPGKLRGTAALASIVVERVLDGLMVAAMLVLLLLRLPGTGREIAWVRAGGYAMFGFFAALLAFLLLAYWQKALALRLTRATFGRVSMRLSDKLSGMLETFISGLRALPSWRSLAAIVSMTAFYWALNGWGMQILARGFQLDLGLVDTYTVLGVLVVGVMIPAGPGMVGTFQGAVVLGLSLFVSHEAAVLRGLAYANVLWAVQLGFQTALGLAYLFSRHVQVGRLFAGPKDTGEELEAEEAEYRAEGDGAPPV